MRLAPSPASPNDASPSAPSSHPPRAPRRTRAGIDQRAVQSISTRGPARTPTLEASVLLVNFPLQRGHRRMKPQPGARLWYYAGCPHPTESRPGMPNTMYMGWRCPWLQASVTSRAAKTKYLYSRFNWLTTSNCVCSSSCCRNEEVSAPGLEPFPGRGGCWRDSSHEGGGWGLTPIVFPKGTHVSAGEHWTWSCVPRGEGRGRGS